MHTQESKQIHLSDEATEKDPLEMFMHMFSKFIYSL